VNGNAVSIIPSALRKKMLDAWAAVWFMAAGGADDGDFNPIEKIGLLVSQHVDQLDIVPVVNVVQDEEGGRDDGKQQEPAAQQQQVGGRGEEAVQNLSLQVFHLQLIVGDMRNQMNSLFADQRRHISTVNANVRRIGAFRGGGTGVLTAAVEPRVRPVAPRLSKCRRDLFILWREWEQAIAGEKPFHVGVFFGITLRI
jgi:hypothetical protein